METARYAHALTALDMGAHHCAKQRARRTVIEAGAEGVSSEFDLAPSTD